MPCVTKNNEQKLAKERHRHQFVLVLATNPAQDKLNVGRPVSPLVDGDVRIVRARDTRVHKILQYFIEAFLKKKKKRRRRREKESRKKEENKKAEQKGEQEEQE